MQLKTLKVKGFKSFADPTTIEFNEGVTAVVGPNGSGKSNVIEAIRWVMGEQSAKSLRGGRMNDVIFSGTNKRKPMNIAQVTLTLDNSTGFLPIDFDEVSISRRLNRNGESDYAINNQSCRLKDIVDLFMDSGLGKESFSIISQGQVEAIFNSKPEERRAIFEEAAGVFKYKMQKQQAERKLEDTQANLDRVQDILYELEAQVEPLKDQAEKAKRYTALSDELTDTDIGLSVLSIKQFAKELEELKTSWEAIDKEIKALDQTVNKELATQKGLKDELELINDQREQLQERILDTVQQIERTESALAIRKEKVKHKEEFLTAKKETIADLTLQQSELDQSIDSKNQELAELQAATAELKRALSEKRERLGYLQEGTDERIDELRGQYIDLMQAKASLNNEEQSLTQQVAKFGLQSERMNQRTKEIEQTKADEEQALADKSKELEKVSRELESLLEKFNQLDHDKKTFDSTFYKKQQHLQGLKNEFERSKARHSSLLQMQQNYAGYFAGVKEIMQHQDQLDGIVGTVADLMRIPSKYLEAIDTVLGTSSQFIVVENEKAGRQAIQYLKRNRSGRATFLPLTTIKPRYVQSQLLQTAQLTPGYIGVASELIEFNQGVSSIMQNLLGNTIVASDLDSANTIARAIGFRHRVVSLDGNVMNAGGSMTGGGSRSNNAHIFTQKEELETLGQKLKDLEPKISEKEKALEAFVNSRQTIEEELSTIRSQGEEKRYIENDLKKEISHLEESINQLSQQLKANRFETNEMQMEHNEVTTRLDSLTTEKADVLNQIDAINAEMKELNEAKADSSNKQEELLKEIEGISEQLAAKRELLASTKALLANLKDQQASIQDQLKKNELDMETYQTEAVNETEEELEERLTSLNEHYESFKLDDQSTKDQAKALSTEIDELETSIKSNQKTLSEQTAAKNKNEVNQSKYEVNLDHQLHYLVDEYAISYEEAEKLPPLELTYEQAKDRVKQLKQSIKSLGPVNLNAIEEYDQVSTRYEFLSEQQADLLDAKAQLHNTMDEMDEEVKKRFKASFDEIKDQFAKVFPQMFGGGQAALQLTDPDDLLTSGVEIIAQPPGKKLASLSLLSGGERALTAISLLFAIIQVSPIPFCILDEAEAALDESNVARFGRYLRHFETDTQFIVITHRRGTMEQADSLYGITMQEKGVSKLVSVKLEDVDEIKLEGE